MFQSFKFNIKSINNFTEHQYDVTIIDSEFEEIVNVCLSNVAAIARVAKRGAGYFASVPALIKVYSARKLNVSKNLFLLFQYMDYEHSHCSIKDQYEWSLEYIPEYNQYHDYVKMYLLFT